VARPDASRPWRSLGFALLVGVALYAGMLLAGATTPKLGLDLRGGTSVVLTPRVADGEGTVTRRALDQAVEIIRQRVNGLGVAESEVATEGNNIVISVPGAGQSEVVTLVGQTAQLRFRPVLAEAGPQPTPQPTPQPRAAPGPQQRFTELDCTKPENRRGGGFDAPDQPIVGCDRDGTAKYVLGQAEVLGTNVRTAAANTAPNSVGWQVDLSFDGTGTRRFGALTQRVVNLPPPRNQVAIVLDGVVVSAPRIDEPILGGQAQITGRFTQKEAEDLANVLRYGALPLAFDRSEARSISPTLGSDQLRAGLLASAIGMGLVVLYSILYYRGLALVAVLSLVMSALLTYALVVLLGETIGFTLTLAGIAGLIVAIGITADSFVVYFERLRDEVREGRTLRSAVERGWVRARRTILSADFVSFLAAAALYVLSIGGVRGFAFTLGLTTLVDVFIVFVVTKPLLTLLARTRFFGEGHRFSGLDPQRLGATRPLFGAAPRRRPGVPREL
jgi:preprotein translocase subunit SecD